MTCLGRRVRYSAAYPTGAERVFRSQSIVGNLEKMKV